MNFFDLFSDFRINPPTDEIIKKKIDLVLRNQERIIALLEDNSKELFYKFVKQAATEVVNAGLEHYTVKNEGDKYKTHYNYDCIGTALVFQKYINPLFSTSNKYVNDLEKQFIPEKRNSLYVMLGMSNLTESSISEEIDVADIIPGVWAVFFKENNHAHGHIVTYIGNDQWLSGTTGSQNNPKSPRIITRDLANLIDSYSQYEYAGLYRPLGLEGTLERFEDLIDEIPLKVIKEQNNV